MNIVMSADDFGLSADVNRAIIEAFERGSISSASIMANMPGFDEAARFAREHANHCFGVHLCFVEGQALSGPQSTLTDRNGNFNDTRSQRINAITGRLAVADIEAEIRAQLSRMADSGARIDYVDSHGHMHKFKPFRTALKRVLPAFGIGRVRNCQTIYLKPALTSPTYLTKGHFAKQLTSMFRTTDEFYMPTSAGDVHWTDALLRRIDGKDRTIEVGIHPGMDGDDGAEEREARNFIKAASGAGHRAVSWREV